MAKFTIKDLAEGKCAVKNDGTVEELNKVLKKAFPEAKNAYGVGDLYFRYNDSSWSSWFETKLPAQSVKDFLEELEKPELPKRGDRILVRDSDNDDWDEAIFVTYIEGAKIPVMCVYFDDEYDFSVNRTFRTIGWKLWKPLPEKETLEVTLEEVAKKFGVDEVKIVEKKG